MEGKTRKKLLEEDVVNLGNDLAHDDALDENSTYEKQKDAHWQL